jgi:hypothetical protein
MYYDQQGIVRAVGAEALLESNIELASNENWIKVEWWLLILPQRFGFLLTTNHCQVQASPAPTVHGIVYRRTLARFTTKQIRHTSLW